MQYKEDYKKLFYTMLDREPEVKFSLKEVKYYECLYRECIADNPLLFYVDNVSFSIGLSGAVVNIFYEDCNDLQNVYSIVFKELTEIRKTCSSIAEKDKIKIVHDYIVNHVEYDNSADYPIHSAHCAFLYKKAVCDGISKAAKVLLDAIGVASIVISGDAITPNKDDNAGGGHAWNIVWTNGKPNHIDFTFDLNLSTRKGIIQSIRTPNWKTRQKTY